VWGCSSLRAGSLRLLQLRFLSLARMSVAGFAMIFVLTSLVTLTLNRAPEELHGRVMGFYTTSFVGLLSVGRFLPLIIA
jgi:hypothetical protein